jgi:hypothetical protein
MKKLFIYSFAVGLTVFPVFLGCPVFAQQSMPGNAQQQGTSHPPTSLDDQKSLPPDVTPNNGWPTSTSPNAPVVVPPINYFDIATGKFGSLEITLKDGEFSTAKVDSLHVNATNLDLTAGVLKSLGVQLENAKFKDFNIDRLDMSSQGNLVFDTGMLLTHRVLQFNTPATAQVHAEISQGSLNGYLNSPRTLQKLSVTAGQKMAALAAILGTNFGLVFSQANIELEPQDRIKLTSTAKLGAGDAAVAVPIVADSHVGLNSGWTSLDDTHVVTAGSELPPDISRALINKINSLSNWGEKSEDIHFQFSTVKVIPDDKIVLTGTAQIYRLQFGRKSD